MRHVVTKGFMRKTEEEYKLMDRVLFTLEKVAQEDIDNEKKREADYVKNYDNTIKEMREQLKYKTIKDTMDFESGFELHAKIIVRQVKDKGFCTKDQLEYLMLYNDIFSKSKPYFIEDTEVKIFKSWRPKRQWKREDRPKWIPRWQQLKIEEQEQYERDVEQEMEVAAKEHTTELWPTEM